MSTYKYVKSLGYNNIQQYINVIECGPDGGSGSIDTARLNDVLKFMFNNGWDEVNLEDLRNEHTFPLSGRDQLRYLTIDDTGKIKYRSGGFFLKCIFPGETTTNKTTQDTQEVDSAFIVYLAHNMETISLQLDNINRMYVKKFVKKRSSKRAPKIVDASIIFKRPGEITKYPVMIPSADNKESHIIYYAKNNYERTRFIERPKFRQALIHGWVFEDEDEEN